MTDNTIDQRELGYHLSRLREQAGIKQVDLARKVTLSPAVMSRIEAGERAVTTEELEALVNGMGTPDALQLLQLLERKWSVLRRPSLDHPDQNQLWQADMVAAELAELRDRPDTRSSFERRLTEYITELERGANLLIEREYKIAFIGSIGIGKSTAICRLTGMEIEDGNNEAPLPILEVGAGGITICDVHLRRGPDYGVIMEPKTDDEIRADVADFVDYILGANIPGDETADGEEHQGISKENERAIRNMSGLIIRRTKKADGKTVRRDLAKELAQEYSTHRELIVEVLDRMELHKRDRRDIWYDSQSGKMPRVWLKDTFESINNGRHPDFTLPKRIETIVPEPILEIDDLSIRIIDTKGIDAMGARADLAGHFEEPHTLAVLCSGFNDAPAATAQSLLRRAQDTGVRSLSSHAALLVLPRPAEALAVKDESGIRVDTVEEGYELKAEQVDIPFTNMNLSGFAVEFFNSREDVPERLEQFVAGRINNLRQEYRDRLLTTTDNAQKLLQNYEQEQTQEVLRHAGSMLRSWIENHSTPDAVRAHIQDSLMAQIATAHASTLRATIRRAGTWPTLDYRYHLGFGARRLAVLSVGKKVEYFTDQCRTLAKNPEFEEAQDLITQAERVLTAAYLELLRRVQIMGQTVLHDDLRNETGFWTQCSEEWGKGSGYRQRVADRNKRWFESDARQVQEKALLQSIAREWTQALERVKNLFESE